MPDLLEIFTCHEHDEDTITWIRFPHHWLFVWEIHRSPFTALLAFTNGQLYAAVMFSVNRYYWTWVECLSLRFTKILPCYNENVMLEYLLNEAVDNSDADIFSSHYSDVIMSAIASQITGVPIVCSAVCLGVDQRKHKSPAPLAFVRGFHRWPVDFPHKGPVTRKISPFDDVILLGW